MNEYSLSNWGDKSLRIDTEEIVVARYNGASNKDQHYLRHKDSYMHDKNNEIHGQTLRKISMVVFLSDNREDEVAAIKLPDFAGQEQPE